MFLDKYPTDMYNRPGAEKLRLRMAAGPLLMQGPMGTLLISQPGGEGIPAAEWTVSEPQTVERLHALYKSAGVDVLITNTFQSSAPALERDCVRTTVDTANRAATDCARRAGQSLVLGSIGSCGIEWVLPDSCEFRAAREAYRDQAYALLVADADGLLLETFISLHELEPALAGVADVADGMPVLVSFAIDNEGNLLGDGLNIEAAVMYAEKRNIDAVGVNCCSIEAANAAVPRMVAATRLPVMARPNAGNPHRNEEGALVWNEDPKAFAAACQAWLKDGASMVGACCGTTPLTAAALSALMQ